MKITFVIVAFLIEAACGPSTPDAGQSTSSSASSSSDGIGNATGCAIDEIAADDIGGRCGFGASSELCGGLGVCREDGLGEICVAFCGAAWDPPCDPLCGVLRECQGNKCVVPCPCPAGMVCAPWPTWADPDAMSCAWPR